MSYLAPKPKPLTDEQIRVAKQGFVDAVIRELAIIGEDSEPASEAAHKLVDRVSVRSTFSGAEVQYRDDEGTMRRADGARFAAKEIVDRLHDEAVIASHGPDPRVQLAERLVKLGVAPEDAKSYADRWIVRLLDGRVALRDPMGNPRATFIKKKTDAETFTDAEWAAYRDGSREITQATREILADIEAKKSQPAKRPVAGETFDSNQHMVAGAL